MITYLQASHIGDGLTAAWAQGSGNHQKSVLVVGPAAEDHAALGKILDNSGWQVHDARTYHEVRMFLLRDRTAVVITDWNLPDGDWKDVLSLMAPLPDSPVLLVASDSIDNHDWAEALNLGAFDILAKPFDRTEVFRVIDTACQYASHYPC